MSSILIYAAEVTGVLRGMEEGGRAGAQVKNYKGLVSVSTLEASCVC